MTTDGPTLTEVRLTTLRGDRLCINCGFNLQGQVVVREPVYGMVMVRCPECSTPASLQEYPLLGKWPGRIAALLAAAWLLMLIGGLLASAGISFGMTEGVVQTGSQKLATSISQKFADWYATADEKAKVGFKSQWGGGAGPIPVGAYTYIDNAWWDGLDKRTLITSVGGVTKAIDPHASEPLIGAFVAGLSMGFVWSVLLLGLRRSRLLGLGLLVVAIAFGFELIWGSLFQDRMGSRWSSGILWANDAAGRLLSPYLVAAGLSTVLAGMFVGLWTGRPLVRWLARLLLPPRLVSALSILWIAEGKPLPKPRPRPRSKPVTEPT